ncbi:MAG: glycoside hydrolase family 9 protein [Bacteroidota bacterium]|nr:glycoside hydrolase family 9 protein [Bacteroidota bacterium]
MKRTQLCILIIIFLSFTRDAFNQSWIRINQLGYPCQSPKTAVWVSKGDPITPSFSLVDSSTGAVVWEGNIGRVYGKYGPFSQNARLDFSRFTKQGVYQLRCGNAQSPYFRIDNKVYDGMADFLLRYMRQQRSGFNPFLKDSCHTGDGYTIYGPMPDGTPIDVSGGWHDASDYLQYVTTSANATYHLLAAWRDFPQVFSDHFQANGLEGSNGKADVVDEARWGLQWLLKMHPRADWMFAQLADDRDHAGFRLPNHDSADYGTGPGRSRPVYFANGLPQGLGKWKNQTTGTASIAGKFTSAFSLGARLFERTDPTYASLLKESAASAFALGLQHPGVAQTAPNKAPYYYNEDNWTDDMELGAVNLFALTLDSALLRQSVAYAAQEPVTPWFGSDTMKHYQWYPFHNFGHYELALQDSRKKALLLSWYKRGIDLVWNKAKDNAFYRGIPFIWCSNNLTTSFAIQCYLYRTLSKDSTYLPLEQACFDWLFGCNIWGRSMVGGLPANGSSPQHPHSSLYVLKKYKLDGGLVDGPVYGSIYKSLIGLTLFEPDTLAEFQSDLVVYHDDAGDYSTNEPTMDGTASLVYLLAAKQASAVPVQPVFTVEKGAITRGKRNAKQIALVFTGDEFGDGGNYIANALKQQSAPASFFLTGNFYRNPSFAALLRRLKKDGHYLGSHSDKHLLYCDWQQRDSLLVTKKEFKADLEKSYAELKKLGFNKTTSRFFLPPYEWYNDSIAAWTREAGLQLINFTPGTRSNADYTFPGKEDNYVDNQTIFQSVLDYEEKDPDGLNGFILLVHIGTDSRRPEKFYSRLPALIGALRKKGYSFVRIDHLLR